MLYMYVLSIVVYTEAATIHKRDTETSDKFILSVHKVRDVMNSYPSPDSFGDDHHEI